MNKEALISRTLISAGPAHRTELIARRSAGDLIAISFETTWPTARKPERVRRLQLNLNQQDLMTLCAAISLLIDEEG